MHRPDDQPAVIVVYPHDGDPTEPPGRPTDFWVAVWPDGDAVLRPSFDEDHVRSTLALDAIEACSAELWSAIEQVPVEQRIAVREGHPGMAVAVRRNDADRMIAFSEGEEATEIQIALERCEQAIQVLIEKRQPAGPLDWFGYSWEPPESKGERISDWERAQTRTR
jgi:hypothetical protein